MISVKLEMIDLLFYCCNSEHSNMMALVTYDQFAIVCMCLIKIITFSNFGATLRDQIRLDISCEFSAGK